MATFADLEKIELATRTLVAGQSQSYWLLSALLAQLNPWRLWPGRVLRDCHRPLARSVFSVLSRARIILLTLSRGCHFIFCAVIINEVAFFRGINFLSHGITKNAKICVEKIIGRVEVSRN